MKFIFTIEAEKNFLKLEKNIQTAIRKKIAKIKEWEGYNLKAVTNLPPATHRIRINDYRLLLVECPEWYIVVRVGHRSEVYSKPLK